MLIKTGKHGTRLWRITTDRRGLTLIEMLTVIIIVLLISALIVTGTQLSLESYNKITDEANAEVLLSTTVTMLRTEMLTAGDLTVSGGKISYTKGSSGVQATIRSGAAASAEPTEEPAGAPAQIYISENGTERQLVQNVTATNGLCVRYGGATLSDGRVTITGLEVYKLGSNKVLSSLDTVVL